MNISEARSHINQAIEGLDWNKKPKELYEPIEYILAIGGKRMRPLLALMGNYLFEGSYDKAIKPSLVVEVFHNFTLMHDDIMDKAPLRRGQDTVHEKWNSNIAILSGDAMLVEAYQLLLMAPAEHLSRLLPRFNQCALEVCEGQQFDMNFENMTTVRKPDYLNMIRLKTAVLLGFSLEMGAILGGASDEEAALLRDFGVKIGIGFQLKDDLLDVYGNPETFGKQVGGDILANKKTFLLLHAQEVATQAQAAAMRGWMFSPTISPEEKVKQVTQLFTDLGVKEATEQLMNQYFQEGLEKLEQLQVPEERKAVLREFTMELIKRDR